MFRYLAFVIFLVCFPALLISETLGRLMDSFSNVEEMARAYGGYLLRI